MNDRQPKVQEEMEMKKKKTIDFGNEVTDDFNEHSFRSHV